MDNLVNSFKKFVGMSKLCFYNGDDKLARETAEDVKESISFGLAENNLYSAKNLVASKFGFSFDVYPFC